MLGVQGLAIGALGISNGVLPATSSLAAAIAAQQRLQYLVEITAFKGGGSASGGGGMLQLGVGGLAMGGLTSVSVGEAVELHYADAHWTGAHDDPAKPDTFYEGRVTVPLVIDRTMPLLPEEPRRVQRSFGFVELANIDGALDSIIANYAVDGRKVRVLAGPWMGRYDQFAAIADVVATGWDADERLVILTVRDRATALDQPLQENLYLGSGGAEGTAEIEGSPKPLAYGRVQNMTPVLLDPTNLIYQFHDGISHAVDNVYDQGLALTPAGSDVADYAALVATSPGAGEFATALAAGLFKLGSSPAGLVTADVRGDADPAYVETIDDVAYRVVTRTDFDVSYLGAGAFKPLDPVDGQIGIYISHQERPTAAEVLDAIAATSNGWWGTGRDGRVRAGRLTPPELRTPIHTFDVNNILAIEREATVAPRWRQRVAYRRNWTVQRGEDLAGAVTSARRQFLAEALRSVADFDAAVRVRHRDAIDGASLVTLYDDAFAAEALADDLMALYGADRSVLRLTTKHAGYLFQLNDFVRVEWPRLGLAGGKTMAIIGIREEADSEQTVLRLWG